MSDIIATVQYGDAITVVNSENNPVVTAVGIQGVGASDMSLQNLSDIDVNTLVNGSVLVYKTNTNKWTSTRLLDQQYIEAGEF